MKRIFLASWLALVFHSLLLTHALFPHTQSAAITSPQTLGLTTEIGEQTPSPRPTPPPPPIPPSAETESDLSDEKEGTSPSPTISEPEEAEPELPADPEEENEPEPALPREEETEPTPTPPVEFENEDQEGINPSPTTLWDHIQAWRAANGKPRYVASAEVCDLAAVRGERVLGNPDDPHAGFEEDSSSFFAAYCGGNCQAAENVARGFGSPEEALDAWLSSDGHRSNLEAGYYYSCLRDYGNIAVQVFANY